jgi:hypothetical protein
MAKRQWGRRRSQCALLVKYGVMSLAQSISFKNGEAGSRWDYGILGKNPDALEAIISSKQPRGRT